jgi:flavin-dependent dehydrogenase
MIAPSVQHVAATPDGCADWLMRAGLAVRPETISQIGRAQPTTPFLATSLAPGHKIKAGDAALALEPLRGDGAGFALRGGLLAQAVIGAIGAAADRARYNRSL